jgi:RecJ-like exonuclease
VLRRKRIACYVVDDASGTRSHRRRFAVQRAVRDLIVARARPSGAQLHEVTRASSADTIYRIDAEVEPVLEAFLRDVGAETPLVLVAEGLEDEAGHEVRAGCFRTGRGSRTRPSA